MKDIRSNNQVKLSRLKVLFCWWLLNVEHLIMNKVVLGESFLGAIEKPGRNVGIMVFGTIRWKQRKQNCRCCAGACADFHYPQWTIGWQTVQCQAQALLSQPIDQLHARGLPVEVLGGQPLSRVKQTQRIALAAQYRCQLF